MTTDAGSNLAFVFDPPPNGSTTSASAVTSKRNTRRKKILSGWCNGPLHHKCPHLMRSEMTTPNGTHLRELICACACHKKSDAR